MRAPLPLLISALTLAALALPAGAGALQGPSLRRASAARHASTGGAGTLGGGRRTGGQRAAGARRSQQGAPREASPQAEAGGAEEEEGTAGQAAMIAAGEGDFLTENGLRSPFCARPAALSESARRNCAEAGFTGAQVPLSNYAFDVHINTGGLEFVNTFSAAIEDVAQWGWLALVALLRGLLVMMEWCYSTSLLSGALLARVAHTLAVARRTFTTPALAVVLAIAGALLAYHGLIRRRIAQSLGDAAAVLAQIALGLAMIAAPAATIGELSKLSDRAAIGTLGAFASGSPEHPVGTLAGAVETLFSAAIGSPWCYLEFGAVGWCESERALDGQLVAAAGRLARSARALAASSYRSGPAHERLEAIAANLERAHSNGALFLALPANGPARNSINEAGSLLHVLCGGSFDATACRGPTAAQAQFRTQHTLPARLIGLALIWCGAAGMLALLGWIVLRLLTAAVLALIMTLALPAAVLAPALGASGRATFRSYMVRLLCTLLTKLLFSLLLGIVLLLYHVLYGLSALGFWAQWLLISAVWWVAFARRRELLTALRVGAQAPFAGAAEGGRRPAGLRALALARGVARGGRRLREAIAPPGLSPEAGSRFAAEAQRRAELEHSELAGAMLEREHGDALKVLREEPAQHERIGALHTRAERIDAALAHAGERAQALADAGDAAGAERARRRQLSLAGRRQRVSAEIEQERRRLADARARAGAGERSRRLEGRVYDHRALAERRAFLDAQAALGDARSGGAQRRDYAALAPLAGIAVEDFERLSPQRRRSAILTIDRALDRRNARAGEAEALRESLSVLAPGEQRSFEAELQRARGGPPRSVAEWLQRERRREAGGGPPPTLAQRAQMRAAAQHAEGEDAQVRRQLGLDIERE